MKKVLLLALCFLLFFGNLFQETVETKAVTRFWKQLLSGASGEIKQIIVDPQNPNIMYLTTQNGFYKSTNEGKSWFALNNFITSVAISPSSPNYIVGYGNYKFWISKDSGVTWNELNVPWYWSGTIYFDLNEKNILYFLHDGKFSKSIDFGVTWADKKVTSYDSFNFLKISFYFDRIFLMTDKGIFISLDKGENWEKFSDFANVNVLRVNPNNPSEIYAGTKNGIYKSKNNGFSFQQTSFPTSQEVNFILIKANSNTIYAGKTGYSYGYVYRSKDGGETWTKIIDGADLNVTIFSVDLNYQNGNIYVGASRGYPVDNFLYVSNDEGTSWFRENLTYGVNSLAVTPSLTVYATNGKLWKYQNGTWEIVSSEIKNEYINKVVVDPDNENKLYVATATGIFKSSDGGNSWKRLQIGTGNTEFIDIEINPKNPKKIYALMKNSHELFISEDEGATWNSIVLVVDYILTIPLYADLNNIIINPSNPNILYLTVDDLSFWDRIYKSSDGGKNFTQIKPTGLPSYSGSFVSFTVSPSNPDLIYTALHYNKGLYKSNDGGKSFSAVSSFPNVYVYSILIEPNSGKIYVGAENGIYVSNDNGNTWSQITLGLPDRSVWSIALDPNNQDHLFIGTSLSGVFELVDGYEIASKAGDGGSIIPSGSTVVAQGDTKTFKIVPNLGYKIKDVKVDGVSIGPVDAYTFEGVNADHTIEAVFEAQIYNILASSTVGGTISPSGNITVNYNESCSFTITASTGYRIKDVIVDGVSKGPLSSYKFTNIDTNHTIRAVFERVYTTIVLRVDSTFFTVNGSGRYLDSPPVIKNGRTLVPIKPIVESLGGSVGWNGTERKVSVILEGTTIELWIGKNTALVNGLKVPIDPANPKVVPEIINGRTMLPLRFVAENLGAEVQWDGSTKTITINYPKP